jgi:hypothetical protein
MKKTLLATIMMLAAVPAFAEPSCNPGAELTPIWQSIKTFEDEGGEVMSFKINGGGCYEIYGKVDGANMEVFFDPNTGEELDRIEA